MAPARRLVIPPISAAAGPLYQQIVNGLRREISEGRLIPGTALPSFRNLAQDLLISVITVQRAYEELEREGIIYRRQGLGTFVSEVAPDRSRAVKASRAEELFREGVREATEAGLGAKAILQLVQTVIREDAEEHSIPEGVSKHARPRS